MILISGAAGKTGRAILKELLSKQLKVRVFVRKEEQAQELIKLGAKEVVLGNLLDENRVHQAADGVSAIYHICPNVHPQEVEIGQNMIEAARGAGVDQFVYHSVLYPQIEAMPHHWHKMRVEELLIQSGIPFTILQPTAYMQNVQAYWPQITGDGIYPVPYSGKVPISLVDLADVAHAAAIVLTDQKHRYSIYTLAGPDTLTPEDIAVALSQLLGKEIKAVQIELKDWRSTAETHGLDGYQVDTLTKMFTYYERRGLVSSSNHLHFLLDREPTSFQDFLQNLK